MHSLKWDDLQYVLVVANQGSVAAAARSMGVSHSTVLRRLSAFEERHRLRVFYKLPTGYKLTPEGRQLLESALSIESTVQALERRIFGQEMRLEGVLRLTTTDTLLRLILSRHLAAFHDAYPRIQLELKVTNRLVDLSNLEVDVGLRPAMELPDNLTGIRLCDIAFGVYGSPDYLNSLQGRRPLESANWLGFSAMGGRGTMAQVVADFVPEEQVVMKADSFEPLLLAAEQGMGLVYMPCFVGESSGKLQRVDMDMAQQQAGAVADDPSRFRKFGQSQGFFRLYPE